MPAPPEVSNASMKNLYIKEKTSNMEKTSCRSCLLNVKIFTLIHKVLCRLASRVIENKFIFPIEFCSSVMFMQIVFC